MLCKKILVVFVLAIFTIVILLYETTLEFMQPNYEEENGKQIKIYLYPLPSKFNVDIMEPYGSLYPQMLPDKPLGSPIPGVDSEFVLDTNQYALEIYFYLRLIYSSYLTSSFEEADLIYYPIFGHQVDLNVKKGFSKKMTGLRPEFWNIMKNISRIEENPKKHFTVFGGCEQFSTGFTKNGINNFTTVMLEKKMDSPYNVIVAPYPAQVHFSKRGQYQINYRNKTLLVSSVWNTRGWIRKELKGMCKNHKNCSHTETNGMSYSLKRISHEQTAQSVFCLSPPDDTLSRKEFFDALLVGCINVINEKYKLPFDDIIDYEKMTIYIPWDRVPDTFKILEEIPEDKIREMQKYIEEKRVHLQYYQIPKSYANFPHQKDAFDMLVEELYRNSLSG